MHWLSVVVPVRNEAAGIALVLEQLQALRDQLEIIVVDGGSEDDTVELARPLADRVIESSPGRARQMNAGAQQASGEVVLFLHADTQLPAGFERMIGETQWGRFDVRLAPSSPILNLVAWMMNHRSRLTGICTGDQAIFVRRDLFNRLGGYADIPLMEDIDLSQRLKRIAPPVCIRQPVTASSRRWQHHGVFRTITMMWWLRLQYWAGVSPARLAEKYYPARQTRT